MAIFISNDFYLTTPTNTEAGAPMIGYHSVIAYGDMLAAFDGDTLEIAEALWSGDTYTYSSSGAINSATETTYYIQLNNTDLEAINYIAIGGHNFYDNAGSVIMSFKAQYSDDTTTWTDAIGLAQQAERASIMMTFDQRVAAYWRIVVTCPPYQGADELTIDVGHVRAGVLLRLERPRYLGVKPMERVVDRVSRVADKGKSIGGLVRREYYKYNIEQEYNKPDFVRSNIINKFLLHCDKLLTGSVGPQGSFFYAWYPSVYPKEVLYCAEPERVERPENQLINGMMKWSISGSAEI